MLGRRLWYSVLRPSLLDGVVQQAILKNKTLRRELGQGEETEQTKIMRDLEKEYDHLKQVVHQEGK